MAAFNKIMIVFGTRPEAIKMAPVILELQKQSFIRTINVSTAQHREMLDQVLKIFNITSDFDLNIMRPNQTLTQIMKRTMKGFRYVLDQVCPDLILIQGDTTTAFAGALAGFYERIPVGHVEAGLRTGNIFSPYPEEANRRMISTIASYHFAPTKGNKSALLKEGIKPDQILVTGNTVIDALHYVLKYKVLRNYVEKFRRNGEKLILVTAHRRENFGQPIHNICKALLEIVDMHKDVVFVYPVHLNGNIQRPVYKMCSNHKRIHLLKPVNYQELITLMQDSYLVLTDSGGLQEEAPALGKPVLVMRTETERPEAIRAGTATLVGIKTESITSKVNELLTNDSAYTSMAQAVNPYGDGKAAIRIVEFIRSIR